MLRQIFFFQFFSKSFLFLKDRLCYLCLFLTLVHGPFNLILVHHTDINIVTNETSCVDTTKNEKLVIIDESNMVTSMLFNLTMGNNLNPRESYTIQTMNIIKVSITV